MIKLKGYKFSAINAGIKKNKLDCGLIYSENPAICIAAFTKNLLKSNSIIVSKKHLKKSKYFRCIIANSGCANTACGKNGVKDTYEICKKLAKKLDIRPEEVLIASTGVIGEPLPKNNIINSLDNLVSQLDSKESSIIDFAKSIMTTDTEYKIVYRQIKLKNEEHSVLCIAKGAGMIAPDLELCKSHATMLVFIITDIPIPKNQMTQIMNKVIIPNFNSFSIDGDTSPNDTVFFISNNITKRNLDNSQFVEISRCIDIVCKEIVLKLLFDGEGVTKVVKIIIKNCDNKTAKIIAKTISSSLLVKTAIYGSDPNWGRILSACGRSGARFKIEKVDIWIGKYQVVKNGNTNFISDTIVRKEMQKNFFEIIIDLNKIRTPIPYIFYTTDLSKKYVEINSMYKT